MVREVPLTAEEAFARLTDWSRHGDHVPLTKVHAVNGGILARTGLGPLGFDDPMRIVDWDPPRRFRLEKQGRVVTGWAEVTVTPLDLGCRVEWREVAHTAGVPKAFARAEQAAGRLLFSRVIDGLLRT